MKIVFKIYLPAFLIFIGLNNNQAQVPWEAPEEFREKLSPFKFDASIVEAGKAVFIENCKACHGDLGGNNPLQLNPSPGDPSGNKFRKNTDGSLFYKISEGRGQMTPFSNKLSTEQIWQVIGYIRTSHEGYTQQVAETLEKTGYDGEVNIQFAYLSADNQIKATLTGTKGEAIEPLNNVDVQISAKRYFGKLAFSPAKTTNSQGNVYFDIPEGIPGDSSGMLNVVAELTDIELFGKVARDTLLAIGLPVNKPSLVAERAMWNKVRKAPIWLLLTYGVGVLLAWGIIFYILFQLRSIFYLGINSEENPK